jgi:hypothetical protein
MHGGTLLRISAKYGKMAAPFLSNRRAKAAGLSPTTTAGLVRRNYKVDLSFTEKERVGDLRGGLCFADSLYLVNRALFVMSRTQRCRIRCAVIVHHRHALARNPRPSFSRLRQETRTKKNARKTAQAARV